MNSFAKFLWGGLLVLAILLLSFSSYHATDSAEVGVRTVKWLGKKGVEDKFYQPGAAYFFMPVFNDWNTYDTRLQVVEMKGPSQLTLKTKDGNDLFVDVTFSYRIDPKKAPYIRQFVARNDLELREKVVKTVARSRTRDFLGALSTDEFIHTEARNKAVDEARKGGYEHFMIKEIMEQKDSIYRAINQHDEEILKIAEEIKKAQMQNRRRTVTARESALQVANRLGNNAVYFNDPDLINTALDKFNAVTAGDVQKAAAKFLIPRTRTVVVALPQAPSDQPASQQGGQQ